MRQIVKQLSGARNNTCEKYRPKAKLAAMAGDYPKAIYGVEVIRRRVIIGWKQKCGYCDRIFQSKRKDATYCPESSGRRCRLKAGRERARGV